MGQGPVAGRVPYERIRRIRLGFRPMTMQNYRFVTEVWPEDGPKVQIASTSWKSMVEQQRLDAEYRVFVAELCRRIGAAEGRRCFRPGRPPLIYWPGVAVFVGAVARDRAALAVRALETAA